MNIKEYIITQELKHFENRLAKLKEINAPAIVIQNTEDEVNRLKDDILVIRGTKKLLDIEIIEPVNIESKQPGNQVITFNNQVIYFPNAPNGRYIRKI
jgi:hypothetical protein